MTPRPLLTIFPLLACCLLLAGPAAAQGIPKVVLSAKHKAMCKVGVGDAVPFKSPLGGKKATVLAFVQGKGWMTKQLLKDLGPDVSKPYRSKGVEPVVFFVKEEARRSEAFTAFADPAGKDFAKIGSGALPRVYVLDAKGKIVWFDIEYTRSTRRELRQTLEVLTKK